MAEPDMDLIPRPYQAQLEDIGYSRNTIISLPTGAGKTYIAIRLINRYSKDFQKPWGLGGKRTFFLVNTIPLVQQHRKTIELLSVAKDRVVGYSGENGVDYWNQAKWTSELEKYYVIVLTSAILADMLTHKYIELQDINLLIFDECHHAIVDHPMRLVMKHFETCPVEKQPRVIGLSAPLLNSNVKGIYKIKEKLNDLETTFHAIIATPDLPDNILEYSANPDEEIVFFTSTKRDDMAQAAISELNNLLPLIRQYKLPNLRINHDIGEKEIDLYNPQKTVQNVCVMLTASIQYIDLYGMFGGSLGILANMVILQKLCFAARSSEEELLYSIVFTHLSMARMLLEDAMSDVKGYRKIEKYSSSQILEFLNILKRYCRKDNEEKIKLACIVFVEQRLTCRILYNILKEVVKSNPTEFGFIKHDFIVGMNVNPFKNTREDYFNRKAAESALLKFNNNDLNCLIATSVIEEGVDIPHCDLVIKFDVPKHYRSYVQSKGRARFANSKYIMMVHTAEREQFIKKYDDLKDTEQHLKEILFGQPGKRMGPTKEDIKNTLYGDCAIPPFVTENGVRLPAISAMSLINRYCSLLSRDQYTVITPSLTQKTVTKDLPQLNVKMTYTQVHIYMPIGCPLKEPIAGDLMANLKDAKCSAALNTCRELYEIGELGENLLPRQHWEVNFETAGIKSNFEEIWKADDFLEGPKPGTKKRVRLHPKVFPKFLHSPTTDTKHYLHILKLTPSFDIPLNPKHRGLYELLTHTNNFGILTPKKLPKLCDFPMFLRVGEVRVSLQVNYNSFYLDEHEFEIVKRFHYYIFDEILGIAHKSLCFEGTDNCMYVVAIQNDLDDVCMDWELMVDSKPIDPVVRPSDQKREHLVFHPEDYKYRVVSPWYRNKVDDVMGVRITDRYVVTEISNNTPFSPMSKTETYASYYENKYGLNVLCKTQSLLEVIQINSRLNCLLPRSVTIAASLPDQLSNQKKSYIDREEQFVPEFCIKYDFSAALWYKATMLPSILHRIFMLLTAYELRGEILSAEGANPDLPPGKDWKPIEVDIHAVSKSMQQQMQDNQVANAKKEPNAPTNNARKRFKPIKETLSDLKKNALKNKYPWDESSEPIDIERNISEVSLEDIRKYASFTSLPMNSSNGNCLNNLPKINVKLTTETSISKYSLPSEIKLYKRNSDSIYPELRDVLAAITTIKSGDSFNMERAETLGDAYLKFHVSLNLYLKFPDYTEGQLTTIKGKIIGNRNLFYAGQKIKLPGRIKSEQFSPRKSFLIPGFFCHELLRSYFLESGPNMIINNLNLSKEEILTGQLTTENIRKLDEIEEKDGIKNNNHSFVDCYVKCQSISDKTVADSVEALIGVFFDTGGILSARNLVTWFGIEPNIENAEQKPETFSKKVTDEEVDRLLNGNTDEIQKLLGYTFKNKALILEALSHPSYIRNRVTRSYERLEFLGDSILDFLITTYIYDNCGQLSPGQLTDLRSALVNNVTFASYIAKLELYRFMCYQINPTLEIAIMTFVEYQQKRNHEIVEDVIYMIGEADCRMAQYIEVPKVLSDVFESLIGAVFVDCYDLNKVWGVIFNIMKNEIKKFSRNTPIQPVRVLMEMTNAAPLFGKSVVAPTNEPIVMVPVTFTKGGKQTTVYGYGSNKFQAKRAAAKLALKVINV